MQQFAWMRTGMAVLLCLPLTACIGYRSETHATETSVPGTLWMSHMVPGETPSDWLIQQFGYPAKVTHPGDGSSVWQYENVQHSSKTIRALPLFAVELMDTQRTLHNFEIVDDRVMRYWQDGGD